jgi:hypothetical protein
MKDLGGRIVWLVNNNHAEFRHEHELPARPPVLSEIGRRPRRLGRMADGLRHPTRRADACAHRHQMPKSLALDVQWPVGEIATLCKYQTGKGTLDAWRARVISSPTCPPTGGCATRALVGIEGMADVCSVYSGPHPILCCGDFAKRAKVFAQLYGLQIRTNV